MPSVVQDGRELLTLMHGWLTGAPPTATARAHHILSLAAETVAATPPDARDTHSTGRLFEQHGQVSEP